MRRHLILPLILATTVALAPSNLIAAEAKKDSPSANGKAVLWSDPGDIPSHNLYYGPGGKEDMPQPPVKFLGEDAVGVSPKFDVRDQNDKKWKAKLGEEAQPEVVSSRLLWAVGYFTNENYFFPHLQVEELPSHLSRGQNFVSKGGDVVQVRLQKHLGKDKKVGTWSWRKNPFKKTREFNGLRIMMALISNWDLKDENNAIYEDDKDPERKLYEVSDVGTSFGMSGKSYTDSLSKNNLPAYRRSKFITKVRSDYIDLNFPTHPPFFYIFNLPLFIGKFRMHWVGKHIPRADAKWLGSLLVKLSPEQIRDAFRAAGYSQEQVEGYATAVQSRIAELAKL
jgi:hypothetical protein